MSKREIAESAQIPNLQHHLETFCALLAYSVAMCIYLRSTLTKKDKITKVVSYVDVVKKEFKEVRISQAGIGKGNISKAALTMFTVGLMSSFLCVLHLSKIIDFILIGGIARWENIAVFSLFFGTIFVMADFLNQAFK